MVGARRAPRAPRAAAWVALALPVAVCGAVAVIAAAHPSFLVTPSTLGRFPGWLAGPLRAPGLIGVLGTDHARVAYTIAVAVAGVGWLGLTRWASTLPLGAVWGAVLVAHLLLLLGPPINGADIYNYLGYARLQALHGLNPYAHSLLAAPRDQLFAWTTWHQLSDPYGPGFTLVVAPLGHASIATAIWVLKGLGAMASLTAIALVGRAARRLDRSPQAAVALCGLCPVWLLWAVGGSHNDLWLAAALAGAALLGAGRRKGAAGAALVLAAAAKVTTLAVVPLPALAAEPGRRARALLEAAAAGALAAGVILVAFAGHLPALDRQAGLVSSLSLPNLLGAALGLGGVTPGVRLALDVGVAGVAVWAAVRAVRGKGWLPGAGWTMLALMLSLSWLEPWYVVWVLPLAALGASRPLRLAAIAATVYEGVIWAPLGHTGLVDALGVAGRSPRAFRSVDFAQALHDAASAGWPLALVGVTVVAAAGAIVLGGPPRLRRSAP